MHISAAIIYILTGNKHHVVCRDDVHSSSEVGVPTAVHTANANISHSYVRSVCLATEQFDGTVVKLSVYESLR